jgi:hypothetical protein
MRHEVVYRWLQSRHASIADVGSGEGYGAKLLHDSGCLVIAVESDQPTCHHTHDQYPGIPVICANAVALPLRSKSVEVAISLQTIEHIWDVPGYLDELDRIATRGVVLSTPNRPVFSPGLERHVKPTNPFHVEEFDAEQMLTFINRWPVREVLGLHHGPRINEWQTRHGALISQLIDAAITDEWPPHLMSFQRSLTPADFIIDSHTDHAQDLIAIGMHT